MAANYNAVFLFWFRDATLLPSLNVQFWKTENCWRLDNSYRRGHRRDIPCLVDATNVCTVKIDRAWSNSESTLATISLLRCATVYSRDLHDCRWNADPPDLARFPFHRLDEHQGSADADRVGDQVKYLSVKPYPIISTIAQPFYRFTERVWLVSLVMLLGLFVERRMIIELGAPHRRPYLICGYPVASFRRLHQL